jgi:hypothetical protein
MLMALGYARATGRYALIKYKDFEWGRLFNSTDRLISKDEIYGANPKTTVVWNPKWKWYGLSFAPDVGHVPWKVSVAGCCSKTIPSSCVGGVECGHPILETTLSRYPGGVLSSAEVWCAVDELYRATSPELVGMRALMARPTAVDMHVCVHFRLGNNETGHWERAKRQVADQGRLLRATWDAIDHRVGASGGSLETARVSVHIASDSAAPRAWFTARTSNRTSWSVVGLDVPEKAGGGVWFGEYGVAPPESQRLARMQEAMADTLSLGECDALYIPTYSSFTTISIIRTSMRGRPVCFYSATNNGYECATLTHRPPVQLAIPPGFVCDLPGCTNASAALRN